MPTARDDVRSRGKTGSHGQTVKMTRMTRLGYCAVLPPGSLSALRGQAVRCRPQINKRAGAFRASWCDYCVSLMSIRQNVAMKRNATAPRMAERRLWIERIRLLGDKAVDLSLVTRFCMSSR